MAIHSTLDVFKPSSGVSSATLKIALTDIPYVKTKKRTRYQKPVRDIYLIHDYI